MIGFDLDVEIRGKATSQFDLGTIDRRLRALEGRADAEATRERRFLEELRSKIAPKP